ncbi:hypothetical protein QN277_006083 [Acacia crassicarpa]|uniref:Isochorismatase-like domain-containing protein n=1 Tax=Acacia crassicarpa TaxID=499986 RepID=A0AAE1IYG6_9FABA|nr:hypothetical protein QN277_006083 [Acacia crassicarpa]
MASSLLKKLKLYNTYEIRKRNPDPKSCALLVIDMQNSYTFTAEPILSNLSTTIHLCRNASIPVIFTRHCHKSPADYGMFAEWWDEHILLDGTEEAELMPALDRKPEDMVVEKSTYGAFWNTQLEEKLVEMGIKEVIVTGVFTNQCCEMTAREAFVRGFRVFFSADATATINSELHEATLKNMAFGCAYLVDCHRLRDSLSIK